MCANAVMVVAVSCFSFHFISFFALFFFFVLLSFSYSFWKFVYSFCFLGTFASPVTSIHTDTQLKPTLFARCTISPFLVSFCVMGRIQYSYMCLVTNYKRKARGLCKSTELCNLPNGTSLVAWWFLTSILQASPFFQISCMGHRSGI